MAGYKDDNIIIPPYYNIIIWQICCQLLKGICTAIVMKCVSFVVVDERKLFEFIKKLEILFGLVHPETTADHVPAEAMHNNDFAITMHMSC